MRHMHESYEQIFADLLLEAEAEHQQEKGRRLYAEAGIREDWIVDSQATCIHMNREPDGDDYRTRFVRTAEHNLSPTFQESAVLNPKDLFGDS